jgi:hypothetical protein
MQGEMGGFKQNTTFGDKVWGGEKGRRVAGKKRREKVINSMWQITNQKKR